MKLACTTCPIRSSFVKKCCYHILISLLGVVHFFTFPVLLILIFLPMWGTRQLVKFAGKLIRQDLCEMATCATSTCANANGSDEGNPRMVNLVELLFEQELDFEQVAKEFNSRAVEKTKEDGTLVHPKLQQYLTSWLGFRFWKKDASFDIKNHTTLVTRELGSAEDLREVKERFLTKPFPKERSPWEIVVIRNSFEGAENVAKSTVIFRCSHVLGDGYSVKKLLESVSEVKEESELRINYPKRSGLQHLLFPFKYYYMLAEIGFLALSAFPFKIADGKKSKVDTVQGSDPIPIRVVKEIKDKHGVSFTSVMVSIVAGALRKLAIMRGIELTENVPCAIPLPKPGHPDVLTNHFTLAVMRLPIGAEDPVTRLRLCDNEMMNLRDSAYPAGASSFMTVFGSFFKQIGEIIGVVNFAGVNISYLPTSLKRITFLGVEVLRQTFCMTVQRGSIGAVISISGYKDHVQMHAIIDTNVLPKEIVLKFKSIVNEEVAALQALKLNDV